MKALLYLLCANAVAALVVGGSIFWFWGGDGATLTGLVAWWCGLLGVKEPLSIHVSTGIVAGVLLLIPIWWLWVLVAEATAGWIAHAEKQEREQQELKR